jgi:hypothetical protein
MRAVDSASYEGGLRSMQEEEIRARIKSLSAIGELPCEEPERTWGGNGLGQFCVACAEIISSAEIEFEVDLPSGKRIRLHRRCHQLWLEECAPARTA